MNELAQTPEEPPPARSEPAAPSKWARVRTIGRWVLFVAGVGAVVALIVDAGPAAVWSTLWRAGVWLPFVVLFEIGFAGMDVFALRWLYGERASKVPIAVWLRSALVAYGIMAFLPAGRAGGERMRAAALAPYVGGARAAAGAAVLQGISLWGNTLISVPCYVAVAIATGPTSILSLLVAGNGLVTGVLGSLVFFGARISKLGGWLGKRIKALGPHGAHFDAHLREMPAIPVRSILASLGGRLWQSLQYAVLLGAVGGAVTVDGTLVAQGIHLVGAGFGDMVPNQAGITESVYRVFGDSLSLEPASAISIALVFRICQFVLAGGCLLAGMLWKPPEVAET
ncbi:MAG: flippase-like domain-containing protein [Sandaracinaceae bacterium]|nr:flippase-like domain-containing protein [Sandaracinaceae bacterium]